MVFVRIKVHTYKYSGNASYYYYELPLLSHYFKVNMAYSQVINFCFVFSRQGWLWMSDLES